MLGHVQPRGKRAVLNLLKMAETKKKEYSWPIYPKEAPKVQYEIKTLPLQNEIGKIRRTVCQEYTKYAGSWRIIKKNSSKKYQGFKEQLNRYGIKSDSTVVKGGAVGGAMLLGYLFGRKKSLFKKVLYPLVGGALVGGAIDARSRQWVKGQLLELKEKIRSFVKY